MQSEIDNSEKILRGDSTGSINRATAEKILIFYTSYANNFPDDSLAAEYLFRAGDVAGGIAAYNRQFDFFKEVYTKYPQSDKASLALFRMGYCAENDLKDTASARKYYSEFVSKYPDHEMTQSAAFSLQNLGKTPEELFKMIMEKSLSDSLASN